MVAQEFHFQYADGTPYFSFQDYDLRLSIYC